MYLQIVFQILQEALNDNLEATAQATFEELFADAYAREKLSDGWKQTTIGEICSVKGGKRLPADCELTDTPTNHPYIRVRDVGLNRYVCLNRQYQYIDDATHNQISRYIVDAGDLIISIVGTIGLIGKIHKSLNGANLTENCVRLTNIRLVSADYLYYTLMYKKQIKEIDLLTVGAVQAKLPIYNIQSMRVVLPPRELLTDFQTTINTINKQVESNTVEIERLETLKQAILTRLSR